MHDAAPVIRQAGEGEHLRFAGGGVFTFKAAADETAGSCLIFEHRSWRGKATPLHLHPHDDETIYVLDGELRVHVAGAEHRVGRHGCFFVPRGVAHAFLVVSDTAHLLCVATPGSVEPFYRMASDRVPSPDLTDDSTDIPRLRDAAARSASITVLGPPPFSAGAPS